MWLIGNTGEKKWGTIKESKNSLTVVITLHFMSANLLASSDILA